MRGLLTRRGSWKWATVFTVAVLMSSVTGCSSGSDATSADDSGSETSAAKSSETFDATNYSVLVSDPEAHKGARVEIVGRILGDVERDADGIYFQMFADPKNSEWNTIVAYAGKVDLKPDDFVRVTGEVTGQFKGENAFGAEITAVQVVADSVEKTDATAAGAPPTKTVAVNKSSDQHGLTITVEKIEYTTEDTRVYVTVKNGTKSNASFYSFNAKAVQGSSQSDAESFNDYPEVQSELLPGVSSSGVIAFGKLDETKELKLVFEGSTDDWDLDFEPYQFSITP